MFGNLSHLQRNDNMREEVEKMTDFDNVSYFTSFHCDRDAYFDPQFNTNGSFTEKMI